jgi:hypothetical protein
VEADIARTGVALLHHHRYTEIMAATVSESIDVAAVEEHLSRYAVSCPLCRAVDRMSVARHLCGLEACDGADDEVSVVLVVCRRCGYLMPLAADRLGRIPLAAA